MVAVVCVCGVVSGQVLPAEVAAVQAAFPGVVVADMACSAVPATVALTCTQHSDGVLRITSL